MAEPEDGVRQLHLRHLWCRLCSGGRVAPPREPDVRYRAEAVKHTAAGIHEDRGVPGPTTLARGLDATSHSDTVGDHAVGGGFLLSSVDHEGLGALDMFLRIVGAIVATFVIFHVVAFAVYVPWSMVTGLEPTAAGDSPGLFMLSVFVQKLGHAITFVLVFYLAREQLSQRWLLYAALWWVFAALGEAGEAITPVYSWEEAVAGTIAEVVYFPLAALTTTRLIGQRCSP